MLKVVKMKRGQVQVFLNQGLVKFKDSKSGSANWKYSVFKNLKLCQSEIDAYPKGVTDKLENERMKLCNEMCVKDESGNPLIIDNKYKVEDMDEFNKRFASIYNSMQVEIDDYNAFMKEETEMSLYMVTAQDLPNEISPADLELISYMVD